MNYGTAFKILRERHGLSQKQLAKNMDRSPSYISKIESQKRAPSMDVLEGASAIFQVPVYVVTLLATERKDVAGTEIYQEVQNTTQHIMDILDEAHSSKNSITEKS